MKNTYLFLAALFLLSSCQTVVDLELDEGSKTLVSESVLEFVQGKDYGSVRVALTETASYFSNDENPIVSNAIVVLNDIHILVEQEENSGVYIFDSVPLVAVNEVCKLSIQAEVNGVQGEWEGTDYFTQLAPIDTIYTSFELEAGHLGKDGYFVNIGFTEPGNEINFYVQEIEHKPFDTTFVLHDFPYPHIYDDIVVNGQYLEFPINDRPYKKMDTVSVKFSSISEHTFSFYENLIQLLFQTVGIGAAPPFPLRGNLVSQNENFENALGNFKVKNVFQRDLIIGE